MRIHLNPSYYVALCTHLIFQFNFAFILPRHGNANQAKVDLRFGADVNSGTGCGGRKAIRTSAGNRMVVRSGTGMQREHAGEHFRGEGNVAPLDRRAGVAVGEWIELLARISHDLRTPLNTVIGFSDVMQNELFGPLGDRRYQEYARHIRDSGDRLLKAAQDTLAMASLLARPRRAVLSDVRLAEMIGVAVEDVSDCLKADGIDVDADIPVELEVRADADVLPRAIAHLLTAALARADRTATLRISARAAHGRVDLSVFVDNGNAYAAGACSRPVQRARQREETGLGRDELPLWIARVLFELQDSPLHQEEGGAGTIFWTSLDEAAQHDFFGRDHAVLI